MKKILVFIFVLSASLSAQTVSIKVKGMENWRAPLFALGLEKSEFIESITSGNNGIFYIPVKKLHEGLYRLMFDKKLRLNFVYDGKNIKIETSKDKLFESLKVIESEANKTYYKFLNLTSEYKTRQKILQEAITNYSAGDENLTHTKEEFDKVYKKYWTFVNDIPADDKSFIYRYISSAHEPEIKPGLDANSKLQYLKSHFWDNVNFNDPDLLNSDLFANKTVEYLGYFGNSNLTKDLLAKEYQKAVDTILDKAKVNVFVYQPMTSYLINGFKKLKFNEVIDYIVDNFVVTDDLCLDSQTENFIQMRINQSKTFKKNVKVPDIILPDLNGKNIELYNIKADKVLILFYSSQCPHCQALLPQILNLYSNEAKGKFEIYAVSLDMSYVKWQNFIKDNKYDWINVSDLKGWESNVSYEFFIYATPTMFLVDKNFEIIDRPKDLADLKTDLLRK